MQGDKGRETNEEAVILGISTQGDKWRKTNEGRQMKKGDFGNQHAGRQMKGDKWRRETRSGSDFGNQQPNLWEVRTPIASSYLGKNYQTVQTSNGFFSFLVSFRAFKDIWIICICSCERIASTSSEIPFTDKMICPCRRRSAKAEKAQSEKKKERFRMTCQGGKQEI